MNRHLTVGCIISVRVGLQIFCQLLCTILVKASAVEIQRKSRHITHMVCCICQHDPCIIIDRPAFRIRQLQAERIFGILLKKILQHKIHICHVFRLCKTACLRILDKTLSICRSYLIGKCGNAVRIQVDLQGDLTIILLQRRDRIVQLAAVHFLIIAMQTVNACIALHHIDEWIRCLWHFCRDIRISLIHKMIDHQHCDQKHDDRIYYLQN